MNYKYKKISRKFDVRKELMNSIKIYISIITRAIYSVTNLNLALTCDSDGVISTTAAESTLSIGLGVPISRVSHPSDFPLHCSTYEIMSYSVSYLKYNKNSSMKGKINKNFLIRTESDEKIQKGETNV